MLRIIIQEKNGGRQEVALDKDEIGIGRVPANDLHLPKNNVSKKHAVIVRQGANWQLVDMRSTNGTFINGQQLQGSHVLQPNDQVIIECPPSKIDMTRGRIVITTGASTVELSGGTINIHSRDLIDIKSKLVKINS